MHVSQIRILLLAAILFSDAILHCFGSEFSEFQYLNSSCFPKDSCSLRRDYDDPDKHNCDCSNLCLLHDTCCIDSPVRNFTDRNRRRSRPASCRDAGQSGDSIFMIDFCSPIDDGPAEIQHACESGHQNWSDPVPNIPVTNMASRTTYRSLFCAICNGESLSDLTMWQITVDCGSLNGNAKLCSSKKNFVINNIIFDEDKETWGLWSWDTKTEWQFRPVLIGFRRPPSLNEYVYQCRPNLTSNCDSYWDEESTRKLCKSHMAAVYFRDQAFRNIHCAICNNVTDLANMSCHDLTLSPYKGTPSMSFGLLLDIDFRDGDNVGELSSCNAGQVFDPFTKKCRSLSCALPGFTLQNRRCVRLTN